MTCLDFILKILKIINPKNIYVGNDYTFGKNGLGNVSILKKYFKVFTPNFYLVNNEKVSSTKIKEYIRNGEVEKANYMLNRHYFYKGTVIKGLQNGSKFLFPTINLSLLTNYVLLKNGVYQTQITIDGVIYDSITNIGVHPTIDKLSSPIDISCSKIDFLYVVLRFIYTYHKSLPWKASSPSHWSSFLRLPAFCSALPGKDPHPEGLSPHVPASLTNESHWKGSAL